MKPALIAAAVFFFVPTFVSAESADLSIRYEGPSAVHQGTTVTFTAIVQNNGPDPARDVELLFEIVGYKSCNQSLGVLAAGDQRRAGCTLTIPEGPLGSWILGVHATVTSSTSGPTPFPGFGKLVDIISRHPDLAVSVLSTVEAPPGLLTTIRVFYMNRSRVDALDATITVHSPEGFGDVPSFCTVNGSTASCRVGRIPASPFHSIQSEIFDLEVYAPDRSETSMPVDVSIAADGGDANPENNSFEGEVHTYRTIFVTNTDDSGSGSLRAAILEANASCRDLTPCLLAFRIPPAGQRWHTIRPESPLPVITAAHLSIDADLQSRYFEDSNTAGPEIELSGELLDDAHGLTIVSTCTTAVRGMAIHSFHLGILAIAAECEAWSDSPYRILREISGNSIGTDPTGSAARPNVRGVHIAGSGRWRIRQNVVSGNEFSGLFIEGGVNEIAENIIGLNGSLTGELSNGGCGVWIGADASGTDVNDSYIGFNHYAGVCVDRDARSVAFNGNSFQANHQRAIDWGLDSAASGPVPLPSITNVRVEGNRTIVEGSTGDVHGTFPALVQVYANDAPDPSGYGEGQYYLGSVEANGGVFRFVVESNLSGKWIAVTSTRRDYFGWARPPRPVSQTDTGYGYLTMTSEFSRAVEVR